MMIYLMRFVIVCLAFLSVCASECPSGCQTCLPDSSLCGECKVGYELIDEGCFLSRKVGYNSDGCQYNYYKFNNKCFYCGDNCWSCSASRNGCFSCNSFYYLQVKACLACSQKCISCKDANECRKCSFGYYLYQGICNKCSEGCLYCDQLTCAYCYSDYSLSNNVCTKNGPSQSKKQGLSLIYIIIISIASLAVFFLLASYFSKKCKNRQQNQQQSPNENLPSAANIQMPQPKDLEWLAIEEAPISKTEECCICLDKKLYCKSMCNHNFHPFCIWRWLKRTKSCPICRQSLMQMFKIICRKCQSQYYKVSIKNMGLMIKKRCLVDICMSCSDRMSKIV